MYRELCPENAINWFCGLDINVSTVDGTHSFTTLPMSNTVGFSFSPRVTIAKTRV